MELPEGYRSHLDGILHSIKCLVANPSSDGLVGIYVDQHFYPIARRMEAEGFDVSEYTSRAERLRKRHMELSGKS